MNIKRHTNRNEKKAAVLKSKKRSINPMIILLSAAVLISAVAGAFYLTDLVSPKAQSPAIANAGTNANNSQVSYPVSMFVDGQARHFDFESNGLNIRYFILKSADGVLRAAFDACDVCWPAGKGYYQDGNDMVCRNCGRRFASELVNEVQGGCNPAPLTRIVQGDQLIIKTSDIAKGKSYFDFKAKG